MLAMAKKKKKQKEKKSGVVSPPELATIVSRLTGMTPPQVAFAVAHLTSSDDARAEVCGLLNFGLQDMVKKAEAPIECCLLEMIAAETEMYENNERLRSACAEIGRDPDEAIEQMDRRRAHFHGYNDVEIERMFAPDAPIYDGFVGDAGEGIDPNDVWADRYPTA